MTVPSASGTATSGAASGLASTGLGNVIAVLVVAALLLLAGTLVVVIRPRLAARSSRRHGSGARAGAGTALGLLLVALLAGGVVVTPHPASAATATQSCDLFAIGDVVRGTSAGAGALPGDTVEPLAFTISNPTRFPITVVVDTAVTLDPAGAAALYGSEVLDGSSAVLATGPLDAMPATAATSIAAGGELEVRYALTLDPATTNAAQGSFVVFDSLISASSE